MTLPLLQAYRLAAAGSVLRQRANHPQAFRSTDRMRQSPLLLRVAAAGLLVAASGCAHHRYGSDYSYQPPLAPAVYPQPTATPPPVAPVVTSGVPTIGQAAVPQVVMPQPVAGQPVYGPVVGGGAAMVPCDPASMAAPLQTQPCPPAQ